MNKANLYTACLYIALCVFTLTSCKKFISIPPAPNLISTDKLFSDPKTAEAAVNSVYTSMRNLSPSFANGAITIYTSLTSDELKNVFSSPDNYDPFYQNGLASNNLTVDGLLWTEAYKTIYRTNAIIEGLESNMQLETPLRDRLLGEVKVVRALYYFYLINLFGDVPLVITTAYENNASKGRAALSTVYDQIISDLQSAEHLLELKNAVKERPSLWSAKALLARVYLFTRKWPEAELKATEVIESGMFEIENDLTKTFKIGSRETIWEVASPSNMFNSYEGGAFVPFDEFSDPVFSVSEELLSAFEPDDARKTFWLNSLTPGGIVYPYKYRSTTYASPIDEYDVILRLSEQYLIRAEARAQQEEILGPNGALADVNEIRGKASLLPYSSADQAQALTLILQERRVELFCEWGHRWFDLRRTGQIDEVLSQAKGDYWQISDALFPIPESQIIYNPQLTQNPNY